MLAELNLKKIIDDFDPDKKQVVCWESLVAAEIIYSAFGKEYALKNIILNDRTCKKEALDIDNAYILHLADLLWSLKECEGFSCFLGREKTKNREAHYCELLCASWIRRISDEIIINTPTGNKGKDFDIKAKNCLGYGSFCIEVKARTNNFSDSNAVRRFLDNARSQLPTQDSVDSSAIMFKIETPSRESSAQIDEGIRRFLGNTSRVSHVIYLWPSCSTFPDKSRLLLYHYKCINQEGESDSIFPLNVGRYSYMRDLELMGYYG